MVRLIKILPLLTLVLNGDTFHAGTAWTAANTAFMCAASTVRFQLHFVKEGYSLPKDGHYLPGFKPGFLQPSSTSQDDLDH